MLRVLVNFHGRESFVFLPQKPEPFDIILLSDCVGEKGKYEITKVSNGITPPTIKVCRISDIPPNVSDAILVRPV